MVKKLFLFLVSAIPFSAIPFSAIAGFQVVEDAKPAETHPPTASATAPAASSAPSPSAAVPPSKAAGGLQFVALTYIGEPDANVPVISGFGRNLKLLDAIKQVVPSGWQTFLKEDVAARADKVSWKGGRRWIEVLDIMANDQNLSIDVDWKKRQLYVGERKISATLAAQRANTHWVAKQGSTLRDAVLEWGTKAEWEVVWIPDFDYPIVAQLSFDGSFLDAVVGTFRAYEKAERPLLVDIFEPQKLIVISPRK